MEFCGGGGRTAGHAEPLGHPMRGSSKHPGNFRRAVTFEEDDGDSTKEVHPVAEAPVEERRDSLGSVRKRMLARAAGGEEDSESEEPAAALPLPKKGTPKKVKAASTPKQVKATKKTTASTPTKKKSRGLRFRWSILDNKSCAGVASEEKAARGASNSQTQVAKQKPLRKQRIG